MEATGLPPFVGSTKRTKEVKKYHRRTCKYAKQMLRSFYGEFKEFNSHDEAVAEDYVTARCCFP